MSHAEHSALAEAAESYHAALAGTIAPQVAQIVLGELPAIMQALLSSTPEGINPWRGYPTKAAAEYLGLHPSTMSLISEHELPRESVGPNRGTNIYFGINILCYMVGLPPVDVKSLIEQVRSDLLREAERPAKVQPLSGKVKTRIL